MNTHGIKPRNYRDLIDAAVAQGWTIHRTGSGHVRLMPPPGQPGGPIFAAFTAGAANRSVDNLRSLLRKRGVIC